jgi:hypothetical protein
VAEEESIIATAEEVRNFPIQNVCLEPGDKVVVGLPQDELAKLYAESIARSITAEKNKRAHSV